MSKTLDEKIFEGFIQVVDSKKILSNETLKDLKEFVNKLKVSEEDWNLLVDKDCFPPTRNKKDGKQNKTAKIKEV